MHAYQALKPSPSPMWVLPMGCSSSQTVPMWVPSTRCSLPGADCSSMVTSAARKSSTLAPLSMGPHVLPGPTRSQPLQASTCSSVGSSMDCRWISASLWTPHGLQKHSCLSTGCPTGCRGVSALVPRAAPPSPSLTPVSTGFFLSHILTLRLQSALVQCLFHFLATLSQSHYHWWAQPWPVVGSPWSQLALAL